MLSRIYPLRFDNDCFTAEFDLLAGTDFTGLTGFDVVVDFDESFDDHLGGLAAAFAKTGCLKKLL